MKKLNITKDKFTESKDMVNETSGIVTCVWCGDEVYEHETELVDGEVVCRNCANEMFDESWLGDKAKNGWSKVKDGAKKLGKKIGDAFNGPFRKGDHVELSGENGETVKGTITDYNMSDRTYKVLLGNNYDESEGADSGYDLAANEIEISDELKTIIEEYIYAEVDSSNEVDGFTSHYSSMNSMRDMFDMKKTLRDENIMIMGDSVFMNDEKIAEIHPNYSSRRVRLCYKQLRPDIIWL